MIEYSSSCQGRMSMMTQGEHVRRCIKLLYKNPLDNGYTPSINSIGCSTQIETLPRLSITSSGTWFLFTLL